MIVRAVRRNAEAPLLFLAPSEPGLRGKAAPANVERVAALGRLNAPVRVGAPRRAGRANASSAVVVVVGALAGNQDARVQDRAPGVGGFQGHATSAPVVSLTAQRNLYAFVRCGAKGISRVASFVASFLVGGRHEALNAVTATMVFVDFVGSLVFIAVFNLRQTSALVVSDQEAGLAVKADAIGVIDFAAVLYDRQALLLVDRNVKVVRAFRTGEEFRAFGRN